MNRHRTKRRASLRGAAIGLLPLIATLSIPLAPNSAGADVSAGFFECRATPVRVNQFSTGPQELVVANGTPGRTILQQCADDSEALASETSMSGAGIMVTTKDAFATTDVIEGHEATAEAGVMDVNIEHLSSLPGPLRLRIAHSTASVTCRGGAPELDGSSKVLSVTLNGEELLPEEVGEPLSIDLDPERSGTELHLNSQKQVFAPDGTSGELTQWAARLGGNGTDLFIGEAQIGFQVIDGSNPCSASRPALSVSDAPPVAEGTPNAGHSPAVARFTVSLSAPAASNVTVSYSTSLKKGTATETATGALADYRTTAGSVVIPFGQSSTVVAVPVTMDNSAESDDSFFLTVSADSTLVVLADGEGEGAILNDDPLSASTLSVNDVRVAEGVAGDTTQAVFTVTLWPPSAAPVSVRATTADGTAHPPPHESNDYVHLNQVLNFAPQETTKQVAVVINPDNIDERDETFFLSLEETSGAQREKRQGVGVIVNDDALPTLSINDVAGYEAGGLPRDFEFTVSLSAPSFREVRVNYATADGTARSTNHSIFGPADFKKVDVTPLVFAPGETNKTVVVVVNDDNLNELDEDFLVQLLDPVNAIPLKRVGRGTIQAGI